MWKNIKEDLADYPERVSHAKGTGIYGYFKVTHDITKYCGAKVFNEVGKRTPVAVRWSVTNATRETPDTLRDICGFAIKFYTEDGIWDLVGSNSPIFWIRDPKLYPDLMKALKRDPKTHKRDANALWDFITLRPESMHQTMFYFSDRGIVEGFRYMNCYGTHTFKLVNNDGTPFYCKFYLKTDQGIRNIVIDRAHDLSQDYPNFLSFDIHTAIKQGKIPSWTFYIQVMTYQQAKACRFNPFDVTKVWPHRQYPLKRVGKLVLNRSPETKQEIEELAFSPGNLVPGIEPSPDKLLKARIDMYNDATRKRLGDDFIKLRLNDIEQGRNFKMDGLEKSINPNDGPMQYLDDGTEDPVEKALREHREKVAADAAAAAAAAVKSPPVGKTDDIVRNDNEDADNFTQAKALFYKALYGTGRERLVDNVVDHLFEADEFLQDRAVKMFMNVDNALANKIADGLKEMHNGQRQKLANL